MTAEQLSATILAIAGVLIQLAFMYFPSVKNWYETQENKGLIMMGVVLVVSLGYFGLSCTSLAILLKIVLPCSVEGAYLILQAFFYIAIGQQLTYQYTRNSKFFKTRNK